jgi:hypothetical protein
LTVLTQPYALNLADDPGADETVAWAIPEYSRSDVDEAGDIFIDDAAPQEDWDNALTVVDNWRSSHAFPLNTFQVGLRLKAKQIDSTSLIAQRRKRLTSIDLKLRRFKWLKLSEMQDLGGCRAVVGSVTKVYDLVQLYKDSNFKHRLDHEDDYILKPKRSGYRGIHLIYKYFSDKKVTYNDLKIEMQFRSPLQHAWATAVETVGIFTSQALKSSRGEKEWLRFFALMGAAIANRERTETIPDTPTDRKGLVRELREYARTLDVAKRLRAYRTAMKRLQERKVKDAHYFLLSLDPTARTVSITPYAADEMQRASDEYLQTEREILRRPGSSDAVLVSVDSIAALPRAYPNYFLDTRLFLEFMDKTIS